MIVLDKRVRGVEPLSTGWKPVVMPLYDTRILNRRAGNRTRTTCSQSTCTATILLSDIFSKMGKYLILPLHYASLENIPKNEVLSIFVSRFTNIYLVKRETNSSTMQKQHLEYVLSVPFSWFDQGR